MKTQNQTTAVFPVPTTNHPGPLGTLILCALVSLLTGCGAVPVRHVPKVATLAPNKMSDLHGTKPIEVKSGDCSSEEKIIGTVGKVKGNLAEWTAATVAAVQTNFASRGATITGGAPKVLTITMTKAHVGALPFVGVSTGRITLQASSPDGLDSTFEGSSSSLAPLGAVDGAVEDAVKKLLRDAAVEAYLRK